MDHFYGPPGISTALVFAGCAAVVSDAVVVLTLASFHSSVFIMLQ